MRYAFALFAALTPSLVHPSEVALIYVDIDTIHEIATAAVYEARPEIPAGELLPEYRIEAHCDFNPLVQRNVEAIGRSHKCMVLVKLAMKSSISERNLIGEDGICTLSDSYERVMVSVYPDGSSEFRLDHKEFVGSGSPNAVRCPGEAVENSQ